MNNRIRFAVFLYLIVSLSVYSLQHRAMFTEDRKMKPFGLHCGATLLPFPLFLLWLAVLAYYIPCLLCMMYTCRSETN